MVGWGGVGGGGGRVDRERERATETNKELTERQDTQRGKD